MFEVNKSGQMGAWIVWHKDMWYLHSDGKVYNTGEYWPTRPDAEAILAKYPDATPPVVEPPPHVWVHGDVLKLKLSGNVLICIHCRGRKLQAFDTNWCTGPTVDLNEYIDEAEFLFNISAVVRDAVKERQAANDADPNDGKRDNYTGCDTFMG